MEHKEYMSKVYRMLALWKTEIEIYNENSLYDINRESQGLAVALLNELFDLNLIDLDRMEKNFPGIDLGDIDNGIAFQVTSRTDATKFKKSLEKFVKYNLNKEFKGGIKFFIITTNDVVLQKNYKDILDKFDKEKDILNFMDIANKMDSLYYTNRKKFMRVYEILENEFPIGYSLINKVETKDERIKNNLKELCELSMRKLAYRIESLNELFKSSWVLNWHATKENYEKFEEIWGGINNFEGNIDGKIERVLKKIESNPEISILGVWIEDYLDIESKYIKSIEDGLRKTPEDYYLQEGEVFHNTLRDNIANLIDIYNETLRNTPKGYNINLNYIENGFKVEDETIFYTDLEDKKCKFKEVIEIVNNKISPEDWSYVYIVHKEQDKDMIKEVKLPDLEMELNIGGFTEKEISEKLFFALEGIGEPGEVFSAQLSPNYILFLSQFSKGFKNDMNLLKKKSNLKIYYFESMV
ncbi:SMEK domain-containing protein [Bacillus cereus]|uniref:SMEK domain-containing protein n=1 Tax=Bacillus cereus TaxID=1396 RepID=UPI003D177DDF